MVGPTGFVSPLQKTAPRFSGFHKDAVVGIDTRVAGVQRPEHESALRPIFFRMRNGRSELKATLVREPDNEHDPKNAIAVITDKGTSREAKIGYLPTELADKIAPMMDEQGKNHRFDATIYEVRSFPKERGSRDFGYSVKMRVEYVTAPNRAPNTKMAKQLADRFEQAYQDGQARAKRLDQSATRVGKTHQEAISKETIGKDTLVQRVDEERGEVTFYTKGHQVAKASLPVTTASQKKPKVKPAWSANAENRRQRLAGKVGRLINTLLQPKVEVKAEKPAKAEGQEDKPPQHTSPNIAHKPEGAPW